MQELIPQLGVHKVDHCPLDYDDASENVVDQPADSLDDCGRQAVGASLLILNVRSHHGAQKHQTHTEHNYNRCADHETYDNDKASDDCGIPPEVRLLIDRRGLVDLRRFSDFSACSRNIPVSQKKPRMSRVYNEAVA